MGGRRCRSQAASGQLHSLPSHLDRGAPTPRTPLAVAGKLGVRLGLTLNMNPGGRSTRAAPLLPSTVPFTAEKVSTTTAGREFWEGARSVSRRWAGEGGASPTCLRLPHGNCSTQSWAQAGGQQTDRQTAGGEAGPGPGAHRGCFAGCCVPGLLGSGRKLGAPHHLRGLCWLQHKRGRVRHGPLWTGRATGQHRVAPRVGQCHCTAQGAPGGEPGPGLGEQQSPTSPSQARP